MRPNRENMSDLEYLSELGFENANITESDIKDLRSHVRSRTFSYNNNGYFGLIMLVTGAFLGVSAFFLFYNPVIVFPGGKSTNVKANTGSADSHVIALDTVHVTQENFISPAHRRKGAQEHSVPALGDTLTISSLPMSSLKNTGNELTEASIKYIQNSPVIFLHDMKITDYSSLYFRKNKFISLNTHEGIDPSYANASELGKNDDVFSPERSYYLHQAISDAMLYFSRKEYSRCLNTLHLISEINPDDINCKFYSGMCYFYLKDFKNALSRFEDCIGNPNNTFLNEARYYKAICLYNTGSIEEANILLKEISNEGGFYSAKAAERLKGN